MLVLIECEIKKYKGEYEEAMRVHLHLKYCIFLKSVKRCNAFQERKLPGIHAFTWCTAPLQMHAKALITGLEFR